jgi:hypothetical protein
MNATTVQYPMCSDFGGIRTLGFSYCQWRWYGIKQLLSHQVPIECKKDWSQTDNYSDFEDNIHDETVAWLRLIIEAKTYSLLTNNNTKPIHIRNNT